MKLYGGIDLHSNKSVVALLDEGSACCTARAWPTGFLAANALVRRGRFKVQISCSHGIFRHYVATAHSGPINELRAVIRQPVMPRAGEPSGSGEFPVMIWRLDLARTAGQRITN